MDEPWTRDGRVRADVVNVAPDVSGAVVTMPVADNQFVKKGDLLMEIDPSHYQIAVEQAQAAVAARQAELRDAPRRRARRADLDSLVVSKEQRENATQTASTAEAQLQQAQAALDAAQLNLERTQVVCAGRRLCDQPRTCIAATMRPPARRSSRIVDSHSFWVYGYFEETKLPHVRVGDKAEMRLMSGGVLKGHVESISRGIYDRDNPQSRELLADVNPDVQLGAARAARAGARIHIDEVPAGSPSQPAPLAR